MASEKIRYQVDVDASDATSEFKKVGKAAETAGKDIEGAFDDAGTKSEQAFRKMVDGMSKATAEAKQTITTVGKIRQEFGELDGESLTGMVQSLRRAGVEFETIEANAKELASTLKSVDDVKLEATTAGLRGVSDELDHVRTNSDQSRSVLANLAGNAAQDLGQLGGVVGTLGVGVGQLAEYAVDGNIAMSNLAKVAGPMAGLAAATILVQQAMGAVAAEKAFDEKQVEEFFDALREGQTVVDHLRDTIQETGRIDIETGLFGGGGLLGLTSKTQDLIPLFNQLGLNYRDFLDLLTDPRGVERLEEMKDRLLEAALAEPNQQIADELTRQAEAARDAAAGLEEYKNNTNDAVVAQDEFAQFMGTNAVNLNEINNALLDVSNTALQTDHNWGIILDDLADGTIETANAKEAWNILAIALGLTNDQMAELADQKMAERLEAEADAAEEAAAAEREHAEALLGMAEASAAINDALSEVPDLSGALASEMDEVDAVFDGLAFDESFNSALDEALDGLEGFGPDLQTLADDWAKILAGDEDIEIFGNVRADDAEFLEKMQGLTTLFQEGTVNAFKQGGVDAAQEFVDSTAKTIAEATGLDISEVYRLMGVGPNGEVQALIQPTIDEAAAAKAAAILDALAGVSEDPRIAQLQIALLTDNIDPEIAALAAQLLAYEFRIGVKPTVNEQTTQAEIDEAQRILDANPATLPVTAEFTVADVIDNIGGLFGDDAAEPTVTVTVTPDLTTATTAFDDFVAEERTAVIEGDPDLRTADSEFIRFINTERVADIAAHATKLEGAAQAFDDVASNLGLGRKADIEAHGTRLEGTDQALDTVARPRTADINAQLDYSDVNSIEFALDILTRNRTATINVVTTGGGAVPARASVTPGAATLAVTPMTTDVGVTPFTDSSSSSSISYPTPMSVSGPVASPTVHNHVTISAAVIGSRFDVQRAVTKALRQAQRMSGARV